METGGRDARRGGNAGISLDEAVELTRTGDLWVFRGRSVPDRAIQFTTNSPVNHVGMAVVLEDMPPLMWHAELGRSLPDMWTGTHQRGVQLHDLRDAVCVWANRYGQRAWLRQLEPPVGHAAEDAVLRTIARLDGTPFPSTAQLAWRWLHGRIPAVRPSPIVRWDRVRAAVTASRTLRKQDPGRRRGEAARGQDLGQRRGGTTHERNPGQRRGGTTHERDPGWTVTFESAYCAEVVAVTYEAMGLLPAGRRPNWYDPGRFWSGDDLELTGGHRLGEEIKVVVPPR